MEEAFKECIGSSVTKIEALPKGNGDVDVKIVLFARNSMHTIAGFLNPISIHTQGGNDPGP